MADNNGMRKGSLQFYPRVRAKKVIPSVNWKPVKKDTTNLLGFIGYKVGMISVSVKDNTEHSMTLGKRIILPATILECPKMKIYSVRFYKDSLVSKDFVVSKDKELSKKIRLSKDIKKLTEDIDFDDVRVIIYSKNSTTSTPKKKPDMLEMAISGSKEDKLIWIKDHLNKEISISEVFTEGLVDARAVTKGYGTQGPMKRFGISLKDHKSEKGRRRPGSLSSFGLRRVTFRAPQAGQTGYHNRVVYNNLILKVGNVNEEDINKESGFHNYGKIKNDYILLQGSIPGPKKRGIVLSTPIRTTKKQTKRNYEVIELI